MANFCGAESQVKVPSRGDASPPSVVFFNTYCELCMWSEDDIGEQLTDPNCLLAPSSDSWCRLINAHSAAVVAELNGFGAATFSIGDALSCSTTNVPTTAVATENMVVAAVGATTQAPIAGAAVVFKVFRAHEYRESIGGFTVVFILPNGNERGHALEPR